MISRLLNMTLKHLSSHSRPVERSAINHIREFKQHFMLLTTYSLILYDYNIVVRDYIDVCMIYSLIYNYICI